MEIVEIGQLNSNKESMRRWRLRNAEHIKAYRKRYYQENKQKVAKKLAAWRKANAAHLVNYGKAYRANNPELRKKTLASWKAKNKKRCSQLELRRHYAKKQRTPKWLSEDERQKMILLIQTAKELSKQTGVRHEVDHIVPLQGKIVSGLNVPWNMQILTSTENQIKGRSLIQESGIGEGWPSDG